MRTYIIYCDFKGTSGNHAGMAHLVKKLAIEFKDIMPIRSMTSEFRHVRWVKCYAICVALYLFFVLRKNDKVFFFEYLTRHHGYQEITAKLLRIFGKKNVFYALTHLSESHLMEVYGDEEIIVGHLRVIDKVFVFGSSLAEFIKRIFPAKEVTTTFHYVDTDYYKPGKRNEVNYELLNVICIGNLKRNFSQLKDIIDKCDKNIQFHICLGRSVVEIDLSVYSNVKLYGYLEEDQLVTLMQSCDVNLSVMEDTIGSNAVTSGLAVGLVQIVSNVGSIKDYCDKSNCFFCDSTDDFLNALYKLNNDKDLLKKMQQSALKRANELSLKSFFREFATF